MMRWYDMPAWERGLIIVSVAAWARIAYCIIMGKGAWRGGWR